MEIEFSKHSLKRAEERGINISDVKRVLEEPEETITVKFGRKAAYKQFGGKYIVVIFEEQKDEIVVVTILRVDKERLKRCGFSRV